MSLCRSGNRSRKVAQLMGERSRNMERAECVFFEMVIFLLDVRMEKEVGNTCQLYGDVEMYGK